MSHLRQFCTYTSFILLSIVFWGGLAHLGHLNGLEQEVMRWRYQLRGERDVANASLAYVDLDAEAISYIGDKPWNRRDFGLVTHALLGIGEAKVVGIDIIFSKFGSGALLDHKRAREGDDFLGKIVQRYSEQVILASAYTGIYSSITDEVSELYFIRDGYKDPTFIPFPEAPTYPIIQWEKGRLGLANTDEAKNNGAIPYWLPAFVELQGPRYSLHLVDGAMRQMSAFLNDPEVVADNDQFKIVDKDGWAPFSVPQQSKQRILSLGLEMFLAAHGLGPEAVERTEDSLLIHKDGALFREIPLADAQSVEVNWLSPWNTNAGIPHYSMKTVLLNADALGQAAKEGDEAKITEIEQWFKRFKDKVIFIGPVDPTLKDIAPTPFNREPVPKVGVHANLFLTIEDEAYISRVGEIGALGLLILITVLVAGISLWSGRGRAVVRLIAISLVAFYISGVFYAFALLDLVVPLVAPVGSALTATLLVTIAKLGSEEWQRRRIKSLFGAYVSPELVNQMVDSQNDPELGGTQAEVTALFSDVEGFSSFSEKLPPDQLVALMNEYLSEMTDALQAEGGTLDKYIGDAIVTMFGMPLPVKDHAAKACLAAMRMQERHAKLRSEWVKTGKWPEIVNDMRTRIGLNTGSAVIGNMGSRVRFNYTMMGDSVNLAARCESGAKNYGVYTMITGSTLVAALESIPNILYRKLDKIVVKGRSEAVEVYELWDSSYDRDEVIKCRDIYNVGLEYYFAGEWEKALDTFKQSQLVEPCRTFAYTTPSKVLSARCRQFIKDGGPENWDGIYKMETK